MDGVDRIEREVNQAAEPVAGKRTRKRDSLFLIARLQIGTDASTQDVRVRNLSSGGLMVELDRAVEPGTPVALAMRGLGDLTGTIAWSTHGRIGIALDHPIDPARARKPVGSGQTTPDYAKPIVISARRPRPPLTA